MAVLSWPVESMLNEARVRARERVGQRVVIGVGGGEGRADAGSRRAVLPHLERGVSASKAGARLAGVSGSVLDSCGWPSSDHARYPHPPRP